jgi:hypothetical protein
MTRFRSPGQAGEMEALMTKFVEETRVADAINERDEGVEGV